MNIKSINSIASQAICKCVALISWTTLVSIAGNSLTPIDYGRMLLLSSIGAFVVILASFGQPQVVLFKNSRYGEMRRSDVHKSSFVVCAKLMAISSISAVCAAISGLWIFLADQKLSASLLLAWGGWTLGSCWLALFAEEARSVSKMWCAGWFTNSGAMGGAATLIVALIIVATIRAHISLVIFFTLLALVSLGWTFYLAIAYRINYKREKCYELDKAAGYIKENSIKKNFYSGGLITISAMLTYLVGQSDLWWIALWLGEEPAGGYGTASYLARFCSIGSILFNAAFVTKYAAHIARGEPEVVSNHIRRLGLLSSMMGVFVLITFAIGFKKGWLQEIFKFQSITDFHVLIILGVGHICGSMFGFGPVLLSVTGRFKDLLIITACSSIAIAVMASPGIFLGGERGVALVFSVGYISFTLFCHVRCINKLGIKPLFRNVFCD